MTAPADAIALPPRHPVLRTMLAIVAAIELVGALTGLASLFYEYGHATPLLIWAQRATSVKLVLAPIIAAAALVLAAMGRLRNAIVALAALMLVAWASDLPSIAIHGLELSADFGGALAVLARFGYPLIGVAALILALRNQRLVLAGVLVSLPTIVAWAGVVAFAIAVSIHGF